MSDGAGEQCSPLRSACSRGRLRPAALALPAHGKHGGQQQYEQGGIALEIWDGYLSDGTPAGRELVRGEAIPEGLYHLVSEILVRHTDGDYLLMRRDARKPNYGGYWEATAGGSALKGEDALTCARRELREETGIEAESFTEIGRYVSRDTIYRQFLCVTRCDKAAVTLREGETIAYRWVTEGEFVAFASSPEMIDMQRVRYTPYLCRMGYLR